MSKQQPIQLTEHGIKKRPPFNRHDRCLLTTRIACFLSCSSSKASHKLEMGYPGGKDQSGQLTSSARR
jgi:hypothetical protein